MNKTIITDENKKKSFISRTKEVVTDLTAKLIVYLSENPAAIIPFLGVFGELIGAAATVYAGNAKKGNIACLSKDEVTGECYRLTHALTNDEIMELSSRMVDGDTKGEALEVMGLLKKERKRK